jgi:hypothetical protein
MSMPDLSSYRRLMEDRLDALNEWDDEPLLYMMTLPDFGERTVRFHEVQIELHRRDHRCRAMLALIADAEEDPVARIVLHELLRERTAESTRFPSWVRIIEIAEILGVTHQRASRIADDSDFPAPLVGVGQSRLWDRRKVRAWGKGWRAREKPGR